LSERLVATLFTSSRCSKVKIHHHEESVK